MREYDRTLAENWYDTAAGTFALYMQKLLIEKGLAPWSQRGRTILEINCGSGRLQKKLHNLGFDVFACDPSPKLREQFCKQLPNPFTVQAGSAMCLPFEDDEFELALLHLDNPQDLLALSCVLSEARRVSTLGFAVSYWNSLSLATPRQISPHLSLPSCGFWQIFKGLLTLGEKNFRTVSALAGPEDSWNISTRLCGIRALCNFLNTPKRGFFGCCCLTCITLQRQRPLTGRAIRTQRFSLADCDSAGATGYTHSDRKSVV